MVLDNILKVIFFYLKIDTRIDLLLFFFVEEFYLNLVIELSFFIERFR